MHEELSSFHHLYHNTLYIIKHFKHNLDKIIIAKYRNLSEKQGVLYSPIIVEYHMKNKRFSLPLASVPSIVCNLEKLIGMIQLTC